MKLSQDTLLDYFNPPTAESNGAFLRGYGNPYNFVDRKSQTLVVTIGDSWTWGDDLPKDHRLDLVYGNQIANRVDADFLSLGECGAGNWHIYNKLVELANVVDQLEYNKIVVLCVFTETGRDFDSQHDRKINYYEWLRDNISTAPDYYKFLKFINEQIAKKINQLLKERFNGVTVRFATNFVEPLGFECLAENFITPTWLQVYTPYQGNCYLVTPWIMEKLESVFELYPKLDRTEFLIWINELADAATERAIICKCDNVKFGSLLHPLEPGHRAWADYIYQQVKELQE
jgi:hypothetical protein